MDDVFLWDLIVILDFFRTIVFSCIGLLGCSLILLITIYLLLDYD